jgi:hypothetical protein
LVQRIVEAYDRFESRQAEAPARDA